MAGVKGAGGPVPKRASQRRRRNKPATPIKQAPAAPEVKAPRVDGKWHPVAKRWYKSLGESGQSKFYEPSDWATAYVIAESMSREFLSPEPPKGASLAAWLKAMSSLLVTEGDRRRVQLELERAGSSEPEEAGNVSSIEAWRGRIDGTG